MLKIERQEHMIKQKLQLMSDSFVFLKHTANKLTTFYKVQLFKWLILVTCLYCPSEFEFSLQL
jgi:hypothetical protein